MIPLAKDKKQKTKRKSWEVVEGDNTTQRGGSLQKEGVSSVRQTNTVGGWIFSICFCATWSGFLLLGIWNTTMNVTSDWFGTNTTGVVTKKIEKEASEGEDKYYANFDFKIGERTEYGSCDLDYATYSKIKVGKDVPVRYWKGLPACSAYINYPGFVHFNIGLFLLTMFGLIGWIAGCAMIGAQILEFVVGWWRSLKGRTKPN